MSKGFVTEIKKLLGVPHLYVCAGLIGLILILQTVGIVLSVSSRIDGYAGDLMEVVTAHALGVEMKLLCFILSIVGGVFLQCSEAKYGYIRYETQRIGVKRFVACKTILSFLSGVCTAFLGMLISVAGLAVFLVCRYSDFGKMFGSREHIIYMLLQILLLSLCCGVLSAIGFCVTTFRDDYYMGITIPILVYYALLIINEILPIPAYLQMAEVFIQWPEDWTGFVPILAYALLYSICWLAGIYYVSGFGVRRRLEYAG